MTLINILFSIQIQNITLSDIALTLTIFKHIEIILAILAYQKRYGKR